jgi:hypothetical protein
MTQNKKSGTRLLIPIVIHTSLHDKIRRIVLIRIFFYADEFPRFSILSFFVNIKTFLSKSVNDEKYTYRILSCKRLLVIKKIYTYSLHRNKYSVGASRSMMSIAASTFFFAAEIIFFANMSSIF